MSRRLPGAATVAALTLWASPAAAASVEAPSWWSEHYVGAFLAFALTKLLVALLVVGLGFGLGHRVRGFIAGRTFEGASWVAELGRTAILVFACTMALNQLGVAEELVLLAFGILFGALSPEVASGIVRDRYDTMRRPRAKRVSMSSSQPSASAE